MSRRTPRNSVEVEYEPLPAVNDCRAALEQSAPLAHAGADSNVAARFPVKVGDADRAFGGAAHVFREKLYQHRGGPFFMECRGAVAHYEAPTQSYTLYVSSQGPHRLKRCMLDMFELGDHQVRVVTPEVGGGFGPKGSFYPEYVNARRRVAAHQPAGEMDRGPPREFPGHAPGARSVPGTWRSPSTPTPGSSACADS